MRCGPQSDDLRAERNATVVTVGGSMIQGDMDSHEWSFLCVTVSAGGRGIRKSGSQLGSKSATGLQAAFRESRARQPLIALPWMFQPRG